MPIFRNFIESIYFVLKVLLILPTSQSFDWFIMDSATLAETRVGAAQRPRDLLVFIARWTSSSCIWLTCFGGGAIFIRWHLGLITKIFICFLIGLLSHFHYRKSENKSDKLMKPGKRSKKRTPLEIFFMNLFFSLIMAAKFH